MLNRKSPGYISACLLLKVLLASIFGCDRQVRAEPVDPHVVLEGLRKAGLDDGDEELEVLASRFIGSDLQAIGSWELELEEWLDLERELREHPQHESTRLGRYLLAEICWVLSHDGLDEYGAEAESLAAELLEEIPDCAPVVLLGSYIVCDRLDDNELALKLATRAASLDPGNPAPANFQGKICYYERDLRTARDHYEDAIRRDPTFISAYSNLAQLMIYESEYEKAAEYAKQGIRIDEGYPYPHLYLGRVYDRWNRVEDAAAEFSRFIELHPRSDSGYIRMANLYRYEDRFEEARPFYLKAIEVEPWNSSTYSFYGWGLMDVKEFDAARFYLQKALELDPEDDDDREKLSELYLLLSELEFRSGNTRMEDPPDPQGDYFVEQLIRTRRLD
ncbi:hypothetical protein KDL44_01390 [bacterium]|nr:hypothetical protein [bacterium]